MSDALGDSLLDRYSRQLMIQSFGKTEQLRLQGGQVLVAGAGGLGSAVIPYLTAAGVGTLGIVDAGSVKRSNLQRQIIHRTSDIGQPKVESAARFVRDLNPNVTVRSHSIEVTSENAMDVAANYDAIVDGLDNFEGRLALNEVARELEIPFVHGAVFGYEGQCATFLPSGPCYRCFLPELPDPDSYPSDEPIGIFPPIPGIIGCIQASETLKWLVETGEVLDDRLLRYDSYDGTFITTPIVTNPVCDVCGGDR